MSFNTFILLRMLYLETIETGKFIKIFEKLVIVLLIKF